MSVTSVAIQFTIVDLLSRGIGRIKNHLKSLSGQSKDVQKSFDKMNKSFKYAAISAIATRQIYKGLKPAVSLAGDLQENIIAVKAELMGAGKGAKTLNDELKKIKATAFSVQAWTPFDMSQIVALEKELIKAGAKVESVVGEKGAAAAAAALAVYEKLDPVETGKTLIKIGTPFKVAADQYSGLADLIARASSASTTGAREIGEAAGYAAGPLAQLGKSQKEMLTLSAMLAQVGVDSTRAGTTLKNFFMRAARFRKFRDANGDLLSTVEIIKKLRKMMEGKGSARQSEILGKMFGEEAVQLALSLLNEGLGSYEKIMVAMDQSASLQDKLNESMKGFNNQVMSLSGTSKSLIANLFQPALKPLTSLVAKTNEFVAAIGKLAQENETISKVVSGTSLGALAGGGVATAALAGAGLYYGGKVLKGTGGLKGLLKGTGATAAGIAAGKAVEAAAGVAPVFVTNWPSGFSAGGSVMEKVVTKSKGVGLLPWLGRLSAYIGPVVLGVLYTKKAHELDQARKAVRAAIREEKADSRVGPGHTGPIVINNDITIDESGRVISETNHMRAEVNNKLNRGSLMSD